MIPSWSRPEHDRVTIGTSRSGKPYRYCPVCGEVDANRDFVPAIIVGDERMQLAKLESPTVAEPRPQLTYREELVRGHEAGDHARYPMGVTDCPLCREADDQKEIARLRSELSRRDRAEIQPPSSWRHKYSLSVWLLAIPIAIFFVTLNLAIFASVIKAGIDAIRSLFGL